MPEPVYIVAQPASTASAKQIIGLAIMAGCGYMLWKELRAETATNTTKTYQPI